MAEAIARISGMRLLQLALMHQNRAESRNTQLRFLRRLGLIPLASVRRILSQFTRGSMMQSSAWDAV